MRRRTFSRAVELPAYADADAIETTGHPILHVAISLLECDRSGCIAPDYWRLLWNTSAL